MMIIFVRREYTATCMEAIVCVRLLCRFPQGAVPLQPSEMDSSAVDLSSHATTHDQSTRCLRAKQNPTAIMINSLCLGFRILPASIDGYPVTANQQSGQQVFS
jgi:hypothetical protein